MSTHVQQNLPFPWQGGANAACNFDPTSDLCTSLQYGWVDQSSAKYQVCPTLIHSNENRTPDLLILNPTPYLLGQVLPAAYCNWFKS